MHESKNTQNLPDCSWVNYVKGSLVEMVEQQPETRCGAGSISAGAVDFVTRQSGW